MRGLPAVFKGFVFAESWALMGCNGLLIVVGIDKLDDNAF
jgi:hypothetical protein